MIAWVLIFYIGTNGSMTISGIESEQECRLLADKIGKELPWPGTGAASAKCFPYRGAYRF